MVEESDLEKKFKNLSLSDSSDFKSEKQNTALETKFETIINTAVKNNEFVENNLKEFMIRLGIKEYTKNKDEWKKFYNM